MIKPKHSAIWRTGELVYCLALVTSRGDDRVGHDPKTIAAYLRTQAMFAFSDYEYEIAARLGRAATAINCDARNNHEPDWRMAYLVLSGREERYK